MLYEDDMRRRARVRGRRATWSRLYADSTQELLEFARAIGLNSAWSQRVGTPFEHFDVTELKRQAAVAGGADPISCVQTGELLAHRFAAIQAACRYTNGS